MKKPLLLISMVAAGLCAHALTAPEAFPDVSWRGISPDGHYLESDLNGFMTIYDLTTGVEWSYEDDYVNMMYYSAGNGNNFSNTGILVASITENGSASYWKDGEWHNLAVNDPALVNLSNGITPDGNRICGGLGTAELSLEGESTMMIPCIWDVQSDGTFGDPTILPYPETDPTGRAPQYIIAVAISADGKTIAGQVTDAVGMIRYPIVFTQDDKGEWSYRYLLKKVMCPDDIVFSKYPGESPERPQEADYMTAEEKASYDAAVEACDASGWTIPYPEWKDYMTAEEYAAFESAMAVYTPLYDAWQTEYDNWMNNYSELLDRVYSFELNDVRITPDGKSYVASTFISVFEPGSMYAKDIATPAIIDITEDTLTSIDTGGRSLKFNFVVNNDTYMATNGFGELPMTSYIYTRGGKLTEMTEYLKSLDSDFAACIDEYLKHDTPQYVQVGEDEWEETTVEMVFTGMAIASADMKTLALWMPDEWVMNNYTWGYLFDLSAYNGVKDVINAGDNRISFGADGNLNVEGDVTSVAVYDLQGRKVLDSAVGEGAIGNDLSKGIYIIRATTGRGASFSSKIVK